MHECLKASEVGQIECQTCEKKIYVIKKKKILYYKKCVRLKEVIRWDFDQCVQIKLDEKVQKRMEYRQKGKSAVKLN